MTDRLVWTSIASITLGALAIVVGLISLIITQDITPLMIGLAGGSISLAILAMREE